MQLKSPLPATFTNTLTIYLIMLLKVEVMLDLLVIKCIVSS